MTQLKGSMTRRENHAEYPEGYNEPGYDGPVVEPVWVDVLNLDLIARFGFTEADFEDV